MWVLCSPGRAELSADPHQRTRITATREGLALAGVMAAAVIPGLFADGAADDLGAGVKTASANQKSTGIDGTLKGVGDLLGGIAAVMRAYPAVPTAAAGAAQTAAVDGGYTFAAATTHDMAPTEYNGVPGENGIGVYGRSGCGRCAAYAAAHPDVAIIDIGNEQYRKTMWAALRARGYTGTSVALPVVITADGFTQSAR